MLNPVRVVLLLTWLSLLCFTSPAQSASDARAELVRQRRTFDLSSEEKKQASVAGFITAAMKGERRIVELYLAAGMDINARDEYLQTALYVATADRRYQTALMLLDKGADPNLPMDKGMSPLHAAILLGEFERARQARKPESAQLINTLIEKGADVNAPGFEGWTPLMDAASEGDVATIKTLMARGADTAMKNDAGKTALDIAAKELHGLAVQTLIAEGAMTAWQKFLYYCYRFARVQGWLLPFLIGFSFLVGYFGKKLTRPQPKRNAVNRGDDLPHLAPLKCERCGAGVPLHAEEMQCPRCDNSIPVPEDYAATMRLREKAGHQVERAVAAWRRANLFTVWPIRWTLWLLAPVWLAFTLIGVFNNIGNSLFAIKTSVAFLALFALLGGTSFAIALWAYAFYLTGTRKRLPVMPAVSQHVGEAELASCQLCGGGIEYAAGDLVSLCGYCGGETYRVRLARRARDVAAEEGEQARLSLYDAMAELSARRQKAFKYLSSAATTIFFIAVAIAVIFF